MSYLYTRDIILVIAITKCQRAKILPIRARCSVCLEMASISRMRTAISRGEWQPWTAVSPLLHARRPRGCQSGREKRQDESYGQKSPWVTTLTKLFSKIQANAGSWLGTKNALYYCAQSAKSLLSSFREFVHHAYCLATLARFVHQAFLTRQRSYRWVEKHFGCYQQEQFNLHWENSVSDGSQCIVNNRKFKMRRQQEIKKSNSSTRKNNNFAHASHFVVHFFAVTEGLPRENA